MLEPGDTCADLGLGEKVLVGVDLVPPVEVGRDGPDGRHISVATRARQQEPPAACTRRTRRLA